MARLLEHAEPKVILVDAEHEALLSSFDTSSVEVIRIADTGAPDDPYERLVASGSPEVPLDGPRDEEDAIAINYTSGTTGDPKGVIYTHRGAYLNALANVIEAGLTPRSRLMLVAPLFHCNGWCFAWGAGGRRSDDRLPASGGPAHMWRLIDEEGVTHFNSAPTVQIAMVNDPARDAGALRADRHHGGLAALPDAARPHARAEHHPDPHLRSDRDVRPHHALAWTRGSGTFRTRSGHVSWRARARRTSPPTSSGWWTRRWTTCRATARPRARW